MAKGADLIAIQVFSKYTGQACKDAGKEDPCALTSVFDYNRGLQYVFFLSDTLHQIASVNMSLGGGKFTDQDSCDVINSTTTPSS